MISKKNFIEVWKDTSREHILNQFYYTHNELRLEYEKWNKLKKWLEKEKGQWGKDNSCWYEDVLDKMQELEQEKDE